MAVGPESLVRPGEEADAASYRCPGCGEMVDSRQLDAVRAHHEHVLHPAPRPHWFERVAGNDRAALGTPPKRTDHPLRLLPNETYGTAADARQRRYGH